MSALVQLLAPLAAAGHAALWTAFLNRLHALPFPCAVLRVIDKFLWPLILLGPLGYGSWIVSRGRVLELWPALRDLPRPLVAGYGAVCLAWLLVVVIGWMRRRWLSPEGGRLLANHTQEVRLTDLTEQRLLGTLSARLFARLPGNQILELHVQRKTLRLTGLPRDLDGYRLVHLSDLHLTGQLQPAVYEMMVEQANGLDADVVCVTGDIIDKARCLSWLGPLLGALRSREGRYFVLGNHDRRLPDVSLLRRTLQESGLVDLGGRWLVARWRGCPVLLAGNERPWFGPAPALPADEVTGPLWKVLLSHSPDQIAWTRRHGFHLMLAGHTHGGQIRLPVLGPIIAPSRYGVKYASGTFWEPPTLMHVSRGLAGVEPLRWNCPPELALLELRAEEGGEIGAGGAAGGAG